MVQKKKKFFFKFVKIYQLPHNLISELPYEHKLAKRSCTGKNNTRHFWGSRRFCHSRVPTQPQSATALKLTRGNHKVLKIWRKALTDRFCARPGMTPGTPPRIIFLLVAPAARSLTADKDTWLVGGETTGNRARVGSPRQTPEVSGSDAFACISSQAHIASPTARTAAPHQRGAEPSTGTEVLPALATATFFKRAQLLKKVEI